MSRIRSENTTPELLVRRLVHSLGYRFRIHRRDLPGKPDIVFPGRRCVVFVHGCFWHGHGCRLSSRPKTNSEYWAEKIRTNKVRDEQNIRALADKGWRVALVWECETRAKDLGALAQRMRTFLDGE